MKYIKEAVSYFFKKENLTFFVSLSAITTAVAFLLGFLTSYFFPQVDLDTFKLDFQNPVDVTVASVFFCISLFLGIYTTTLQYLAIIQKERNIKVVLQNAFKALPKILGFSIVITLIVLGGVILLVIPGIIFGIWYSFTLFVGIDKNLGLKEALKRSKEIVSGKFWKVLGNYILFGLFAMLVQMILSAIPYAGQIIISLIAPLFVLPSYYLYRALEGKE